MAAFQNTLVNAIIHLKMFWVKHFLWNPFLQKTNSPQTVQDKLLRKIISKNKDTLYGKKHSFDSITTYKEYSEHVPVNNYEDLRPYIEDQEQKNEPILNSEQPTLYAQTSGTTGKPKYIPLLPSMLAQNYKSQALFSYAQYLGIPSIYRGKILAISSPTVEGYLDTGTPYGSMSGLINKGMPSMVKMKYVVPFEVNSVEDYQLKYLLISLFALKEREITLLGSANPSTFFKLLDVIKSNLSLLLDCLETGNLSELGNIPPDIQRVLKNKFTPDKSRADELKPLVDQIDDLTLGMFWPDLQALVTWMGGSGGVLMGKLRKVIPNESRISEMGYLSSEFRGSITVDVVNNVCLPTFHENFFEFVELADWDNPNPSFLTLEQVEEGKHYYVIVTTQGGLYRYFINDIVQINKKFNETPAIQFVQKGRGITNLTGEKLYENQVNEALTSIKEEINADFDFFIMIADQEQVQYILYIESPTLSINLAESIEQKLSQQNIEFEAKLKSGRLKPLHIVFLKEGTSEAYKKNCLQNGQREAQYKLVRLQYSKDCPFDFSSYKQ